MLVLAFLCTYLPNALANESDDSVAPPIAVERFAIHGQFTYVEQETDAFRAPYAGANSLSSKQGRETTDFTLFLGMRTFDYAADAWGYTVGASAEWYHGAWTTRVGVFDLSNIPNSVHLDPGFHEFQLIAEIEQRHTIPIAPAK